MSTPGENTASRQEIRAAVAEFRRNERRTDSVVTSASRTLEQLRAVNTDHLAERLRDIIRGAA